MEQSHWIIDPTCSRCNGMAERVYVSPTKRTITCFDCGLVRVEELRTWECTLEYFPEGSSNGEKEAA